MAINAVAVDSRAQLARHFTKVMFGFAMASGAILRVYAHTFNAIIMDVMAGGAFNFAFNKTLAAGEQLCLIAMNINGRNSLGAVKAFAAVEISQGITRLKLKRRPCHYTRVA